MKKYSTVIFDLDGTLLNTLDDLSASVNYALEVCGYPLRNVDEVRRFVGNGVEKLIERAVPEEASGEDTKACLDIFKVHYKDNMNNQTRPYDGIMEILENLKAKNIKIAVVSNKMDYAVKVLCENKFNGFIQVAIGSSKGVAKKPAPDTVLEALRSLDSKSEEALFVGDSDVDMETAKNASITSVGVTWGFRDREILEAAGADFIIENPKELDSFFSLKNKD
ncbi:MAG: HAD family hydrolase [Clostridiales bacterium]|nr:HAD family hydrolase [Clostridiales bacterium]